MLGSSPDWVSNPEEPEARRGRGNQSSTVKPLPAMQNRRGRGGGAVGGRAQGFLGAQMTSLPLTEAFLLPCPSQSVMTLRSFCFQP